MIKVVVFDFDDTITDNSYLDYASFKIICKRFNIKNKLSLKDLVCLRKKSYTAMNIVKIIKNSTYKNFSLNNFLNARTNFLLSYESNNYLKVKKYTKNLLKYLHSKKISIIICTVRHDKNIIKKFLKNNDIEMYFKNIICLSDLKLDIPNNNSNNRVLIKSSLLKKIISKNKIKYSEMLYVGNSFEDQLASSIHKINFIKFDNDYLPLENKKYNYSTNSMRNLHKILGNIIKND